MPNVVKRFWYIKEYTSYFPPIIKGLVDLISDKSWLMLEFPDLNPDWFWNIKSFLMKKENMLLYSNISKIFPHIGRSETGLYPPGNKTSRGRRNDASVEHRQDVSVVCLHDVLLVCRDDVSRGLMTTSHQYPSTTSQISLKWNTQRRLSGTSPRHHSGTYPRRPISTSLRRLL